MSSGLTSTTTALNLEFNATTAMAVDASKVNIVKPILLPQTALASVPTPAATNVYMFIDPNDNPITGLSDGRQPPITEYYYLRDEKAAGTAGGAATSGSWFTRTLTTLTSVPSTSTNCTLASNQFTLQPGRYNIYATSPAYRCGNFKTRLFDVTNNTAIFIGTAAVNPALTTYPNSTSTVNGIVDIAVATTYRIEMQVQTTRATDGLGTAAGFTAVEVYTTVQITRFGN